MNISDNFVGLVTILGAFMIPIVAILVSHQQKMAALFRQGQNVDDQTVARLGNDVQELRALVTQQSIALDNLAESQRKMLAKLDQQPLSDRLNA